MSTITYIVTPQTIKDRTALHTNLDDKFVYPEIKAVEDMYVLPLLGSALYKKIIAGIGDDSLSGYYKQLVDDYLIDMICNYVMSEIPESINYQFTNKGVVSKTSDNTNQISMSDMYSIVDRYKTRAQHYEKRAIMFLRQNAAQYMTEYFNPGNGIDDIRPQLQAFTSPIYLDDGFGSYPAKSYEEMYQGNRPNCY